jgi:putative chitinase
MVEWNNMITLNILKTICPKTKPTILEKYVEPINTVGEYYEMFENPKRIAGFLAQVAHESGGFTAIKENLNYSAKGLMTTFKKYFPDEATAKQYEKKPEKIANRVYANRMKNGDEASGDGYRFCGRGLIQLTGRDNYTKFAQALNMSIEDTIAYLETPNGALVSAAWFWDNNKLNQYCDRDDFVTLTKRINGGTIGLEDRKHHYQIALNMLQG